MKTAAQSNWHTMIHARSRDLQQMIADKIRLNPSLIGQVRETLARWLRSTYETDRGRGALVEWQRKLEDQPLNEVLEFTDGIGSFRPIALGRNGKGGDVIRTFTVNHPIN